MDSVSQRKWLRKKEESSCYQVSWVENGRQHKKSGFKTKKAAETFATVKEAAILDGTSREQSHRKSVAEAAAEYLEQIPITMHRSRRR